MELTQSKWKYFTVFNLKELLTVKVKRKPRKTSQEISRVNLDQEKCMVVEPRMQEKFFRIYFDK